MLEKICPCIIVPLIEYGTNIRHAVATDFSLTLVLYNRICVSKPLNMSNSCRCVVTVQYCYIYCRRKQQCFIAFISNATCFGRSYGPSSGTEYTSKTQVFMQANLSKPTGYVMHQQCNIQQLYALPTLYLCVLYLSENKQRLVPLTA